MIACVGETLEQREAGTTMEVVAAQTKAIAGIDFETKISSNSHHFHILYMWMSRMSFLLEYCLT